MSETNDALERARAAQQEHAQTHHVQLGIPATPIKAISNPSVHVFGSTAEAYDASQTWDDVKDGDVLAVPSENVVGILFDAWPGAISEATGRFHEIAEDLDLADVPTSAGERQDYSESFELGHGVLERMLDTNEAMHVSKPTGDMVDIKMSLAAASNGAVAVARRLAELAEYHREHPELPTQYDVVETYEEVLKAFNAVLPENLKQDMPFR